MWTRILRHPLAGISWLGLCLLGCWWGGQPAWRPDLAAAWVLLLVPVELAAYVVLRLCCPHLTLLRVFARLRCVIRDAHRLSLVLGLLAAPLEGWLLFGRLLPWLTSSCGALAPWLLAGAVAVWHAGRRLGPHALHAFAIHLALAWLAATSGAALGPALGRLLWVGLLLAYHRVLLVREWARA